ncbi:MAG TPA: peptide ABC transporter substrate-binding protein [Chloroflexia bacterium]|nr:peptide ABC transporter substrate-binding protein [Chloroflexia bacterium]
MLTACGGDEPTATTLPTNPAGATATPSGATTVTAAAGTSTTSAAGTTSASSTTAGTVNNTPGGNTATSTPTAGLPAGTPYPASTAGVPPTPTLAGAIKPDQQTLNMVWDDVSTFDPALAADSSSSFILRQLYSGLLSLDSKLNPVPDLAERMPDISENGTLYTFKIRPGARFQSGREITADDFKYSLERAADPKLAAPDSASTLPAATYMTDIVGVKDKLDGKASEISGVRVKDKQTLEIKLDGPKPQFLAKLTFNVFFVVNKDAVEKGFDKIDGSGPFKLVDYKRSQYLHLARNDNYYLGKPRLEKINFALGANAANSLALYEQGKIDVVNVGASSDVERALDKSSPLNKELVVKPQLSLTYLGFNTRMRPFDDLKVRQAFSIIVDRSRIARAMFENKVLPATGILPPGMPGYTGKTGPLTYDISRARDLIAQSSYRSPANLPRITLYSTGDPLAGVLQEVYKQAFGIDLEVQQYDYKSFQNGLSQKQFQMFLNGWTADYPDPENFLRSLLGEGSAFNDTGYSNPQFEDLMKQGDQQQDLSRRLDFYSQAEQVALADAPILPIYYDVNYTLVKPYVKGLDITESGILSLKDVYILK